MLLSQIRRSLCRRRLVVSQFLGQPRNRVGDLTACGLVRCNLAPRPIERALRLGQLVSEPGRVLACSLARIIGAQRRLRRNIGVLLSLLDRGSGDHAGSSGHSPAR